MKDLRLIFMDCEYTDPDDSLIDSIIDGVHAEKLQERLLDRGEELPLAKAIEIGQQYEMSQKQVRVVRDEEPPILAMDPKKTKNPKNLKKPDPRKGKHCPRCGKDPQHDWNQGKCPALGSTCSYCKKPNHWLAVCNRRLRVHKIDTSSDDESETEVLHIHMTQPADAVPDDKWTIRCRVENKQIKFKIDTGARCNTLTPSDHQKIQHEGELKRSTKLLRTYSNHQIKPVAVAELSLEHNSNLATTTFQIVDIDQENVLSGNTAEALQLISRLASIGTPAANEGDQVPEGLHEFPDLTQTTSTLPGTYTIKLEPNAKGVVHAARRLSVALKERAINKLHEMETKGYIIKVTEPTEWVSSMVVSIQGDKVRICIDPSDLNKVIKREQLSYENHRRSHQRNT